VNISRVLVGVAVLAMLCGCSSGASPKPMSTRSPSPLPCQADTDSVTPGHIPLTQIQPTSAATPSTITTQVRLTCGTTLYVTRKGAPVATFGTAATRQLMQLGGVPVGALVSREPTGTLFSLNAGQVWCRALSSRPEQALICGTGPVYLTMINTRWTAACSADHVFKVAVYSGSVQVRYPKTTKYLTLRPGRELVYYPATGRAAQSTIIFSATDITIFSALGP
jgi:hypothetical protein